MKNDRKPGVPLSDAEEARIQAGIALDPDNPEWTAEDFAKARPFAEVFPTLAVHGRPRLAAPKKLVSLRLDADMLDRFKSTGPGWQARMNEALRKAVGL